MTKRHRIILLFVGIVVFGQLSLHPCLSSTVAPAEPMSLEEAIDIAMAEDLGLKSSKESIQAALAAKKAQKAQFFPRLSASYQWEHFDEGQSISPVLGFAKDQFTLAGSITQPVFTGFILNNQYKLAKLGLTLSEVQENLVKQDVLLRVKQIYFSLLRFQKLLLVAQKTVEQIESQKDVARNFFEVGMTPMNDLLAAQVELANAEQALIVVKNNLEIAKSNFNSVLRRPIGTPVNLEDILDYTPFAHDLAYCQQIAGDSRLEAKIADLEVDIAGKQVELVKGEYYPTVNFQANYFRVGGDWTADGGEGVGDPSGWNVVAVAEWNFWEWGKTKYSVEQKRRELSQVEYSREDLLDQIRLQVKEAYLRTKESEDNIKTAEKAIEQAKENYRINQERYKEQVGTNTDVLIAQTLLTQTMTNYYNALYDFHLSKAALLRAMGQDIVE